MSQRAVEALLGRLVTDREFRHRFYLEPGATCVVESLDLTARELEAVLRLEESRVEELTKWLDAKIVRAGASVHKHEQRSPVPMGSVFGMTVRK